MKKLACVLKIVVLLSTLAIVAWSAVPSDAGASVTCEGTGHSCHAIIGGHTYHLEEAAMSY